MTTQNVAVALGALALSALTMCGTGNSGNGGSPDASASSDGGSTSGSASGSSSSGSGSGSTSGSGSSGGSSGGGSSGASSGSGTSGSSGGSSTGSTSGSGSSSGADDAGGDADASQPDAPAGPFAIVGSDFDTASGAAPPMGSNLCFKNGQTHSTGDISPPLSWSGAPAGTMSYAVSLHDTSNGITHWVMWNIPADVTSLAAMLPSGAMPGPPAPPGSMQRGASFVGADQYAGPGAGPPVHAYRFTVWAMNTANVPIADGDSTDTVYSQDLPMNSLGSATLLVCGDQNADCNTCSDGGS